MTNSRPGPALTTPPPPQPSPVEGEGEPSLRRAARLMEQAEDESVPLHDRLRALHNCGRTLDTFFQVRVASLREQEEMGMAPADDLTPSASLREIRRRVEELYERQSRVFRRDLMRRLAGARIDLVDAGSLAKEDAAYLGRYFQERVFPLLTPTAVDPGHPFPHAPQPSLSLAVMVRHPLSRQEHFAFMTVPRLLPRFVALPGGRRFLPLERVVVAHLRALFPGMEIVSHAAFRLTRDADLDLPRDRVGDPATRDRRRARAVRLEINPEMPEEIRNLLVRELLLTHDDVYVVDGLLDPGWVHFIPSGR